ncbi:TolC family protein [Chondromyces crocatus]|uniref:Outer membrane efflux protein n=1 Tax=Chondromyces crocatus TaxID=52 RepID=A0A0K1EH33_CHOCO|nr:TolC family protein [Chondromyces crocatus]AKT40171.1 outer membrane efflux protein [Chondromyces crocatus]
MKDFAASSRRFSRTAPSLAVSVTVAVFTSLAHAQPAPAQPEPAAPAAPAATQAGPAVAPAAPSRPDPVEAALAPRPGGTTPEQVAQAAVRVRPSLRVKQAELQQASAKVDQALVSYFPKITLGASFSYQNPVVNSLGTGPTNVATVVAQGGGTNAPQGPITVGPCDGDPSTNCLQVGGTPAQVLAVPAQSFEFPVITNTYQLTAGISVPISDYILRLAQGYSAAAHSVNSKKLEVQAEELTIAADAKIAFFNWVRAKGNQVVAKEAVAQAQAHLEDAKRAYEVGRLSRVDVLRLEAQVASADQVVAETSAMLSVAEEQIRIAVNAPADRRFEIGIDVMAASTEPPSDSLQTLQQEALRKRLEIRALDETIYSLKDVESVTRAGYMPRIDATANVLYANPNPRVFPMTQDFRATWDAGVRLTWTVNDTFSNIGAMAEARGRTAQIQAQKTVLRDGLRLEVASAYNDVLNASSRINSAERQLAAAEETMRVRAELFRAGRATSVEVVDAETELTRARLAQLDGRIGILVARTRLEHAVGRDIK